ncbi:MAG: AAA family ATPase [Sandaracinaceae bacterium]|nr:AAA family ATPase [Sandaracinaceae bacterium]
MTDFGLALDAATDTAATNALVGSPAYMAPEQVVGGAITVATDIYAFGVVLYELLTGRLPFEGETALATAVRRLGTPPPSMRGVVPGLPARWEEAILRCLRLPQHERFDTCADVVRELRSASPTTRSYSPRGSERRKVALVLADDPRDGVAFQELMRQHGGTSVTLAQARMAAVFGAEQSLGDEIDRALAAAHAAALAADCVALSIGHASLQGGSLEGDALREAQAACERRHGGVVAGAQTATRLTTRCEIVEVEPGLFALGPLRRVASASLVGREAELSALRRARDAVLAEGRGLATWILGPPGTGKSRLAEAAIGIALDEGMGVWSARASAHDPHAYGLFARPSDAATEESRSARALSAGDASVARLSQTMGRGPDPRAMADRARARALARLGELAEAGPFALVLDDLQWADPSSLALVSELALVLEGKAVWLVLAARDELVEAHPELLESVDSTGRIDPSPLRAADVAALAIARTGARASPAIAQALADRAGGNPLFVEQLLDVLDPRDLQGDAIAEWPLPASIELAVQARLDQLPGLERECVERLSVHGRAASAAQLETLGGGSLREALASLGRRGLVVRVAAEGARSARGAR